MSKIDIMFSCELKCLSSFISLSMRFASMESLKASLIFFIATFSPVQDRRTDHREDKRRGKEGSHDNAILRLERNCSVSIFAIKYGELNKNLVRTSSSESIQFNSIQFSDMVIWIDSRLSMTSLSE